MSDAQKLTMNQRALEELTFQLEEAEDCASEYVGKESQLALELMAEFELTIDIVEEGVEVVQAEIKKLEGTQKPSI